MQCNERTAYPGSLQAPAGQAAESGSVTTTEPIHRIPQIIEASKRGQTVTLAKIAVPDGETIPAMISVYGKGRVSVPSVISIPIRIIDHARCLGCQMWIARFDAAHLCLRLPLPAVESSGWAEASEGFLERFVPLERFERSHWTTWPFVEGAISIDDLPRSVMELATYPARKRTDDRQLPLFEVAG